jgi:hypothetical protein
MTAPAPQPVQHAWRARLRADRREQDRRDAIALIEEAARGLDALLDEVEDGEPVTVEDLRRVARALDSGLELLPPITTAAMPQQEEEKK